MRRGLIVLTSVLAGLPPALAGCDPLADSDYVGEPMFTLKGTLVATSKDAPSASGVALAWQDPAAAGGPGIATSVVPVQTELPATVTIHVPLPPPDAARFAFDDTDVELAEAFVLLVDDVAVTRPVPRGIVRDRVVVFATHDVADGTQAADYLGGPVGAGYHLRRLVQGTPGPSQQIMIDRCIAAGASDAACQARRGYQLAPAADDDLVHMVVAP